jgi:DNA repair exonuclease SbcCD ATPase subunit
MTDKPTRGTPPPPPRQSSGYGTPAQQGQSSPPPYDPTELLNDLNKQLGDAKSQVQKDTALVQSLTSAIAALTKTAPEVDAVAAAYEAGYGPVWQDEKALEDYRDAQRRLVDCATQGIKDCLEQASAWVDKQIDDAGDAKCKAEDAVDQANAAADAAAKGLKDAQAAYDDLKGRLAAVQQKLKQVKDLQKNLQDQEKLGNATAMYVYLAALSDQLARDPPLLTTTDFRQQLQAAWTALANAQNSQAQANAALKGATAAQDAAAQNLKRLQDNRIGDMLRRAAACADTGDEQQQQSA